MSKEKDWIWLLITFGVIGFIGMLCLLASARFDNEHKACQGMGFEEYLESQKICVDSEGNFQKVYMKRVGINGAKAIPLIDGEDGTINK